MIQRVLAVALISASLVLPASAERLITIPTARKLFAQQVRYEVATVTERKGTTEMYFGYGIDQMFSFELRTQRFRNRDLKNALDLNYQIIGPLPDLSPGVAIGFQDITNQTDDGRRFYVAFTQRQTVTTLDGDRPFDLTLGFFLGRNSSPMLGFSLPMSEEVRLLVDHNGYRLSYGFEVRPAPEIGFRMYGRGDQSFISIFATKRF